jgi:glutamate racemase
MIGVFDSGVGGLTVLKALRTAMPQQDFMYVGDTARVPYGRKPAEMVRRFALEIGSFLVSRGAQAIVVACNTATACALDSMTAEFTIPIWGVIEPGVQAAVLATRTGNVGVIGTQGTIASGAYQRRLRAHGIRVWAKACPLFVHLVEEDLLDSPEAELVTRHYLKERPEIDTLVLGCTHYPLLAPMLSRVLGPQVTLVESAQFAAQAVRDALPAPVGKNSGRISHFVTGDSVAYEHTAAVIGGIEGEILPMAVTELQLAA